MLWFYFLFCYVLKLEGVFRFRDSFVWRRLFNNKRDFFNIRLRVVLGINLFRLKSWKIC